MWTTLAIAAALSLTPAQGDKLQIKNDRITYGILGQERKETEFLPGDTIYVCFDLDGLLVNSKDGKVHYSIGMDLIDSKTPDKPFYSQTPDEREQVMTLGGSRLQIQSMAQLGTDLKAGEYSMKVTITDVAEKSKPTTVLTRKFKVAPAKFGFVNPFLANGGSTNPPVAFVGQALVATAEVVGFQLDDKMLANMTFEMKVLDEKGQPTTGLPFTVDAKNIPPELRKKLPIYMPISATRTGTFTIKMTATDKMAKPSTTIEQTLTLTVIDVPK